MVYNNIYAPSTGTDPTKFDSITAFAKYCKKGLCKLAIESFRNAGNIAEYARQHTNHD